MPSTDHPPCSSSVLRARSLLITRVTSRSTGLPVPRASLTLPAAWVYLVPVGRATVPPSGRRRQRLPRRGSHDARSRPILLHWPVPRERGNAARASRRSRGGRRAGAAYVDRAGTTRAERVAVELAAGVTAAHARCPPARVPHEERPGGSCQPGRDGSEAQGSEQRSAACQGADLGQPHRGRRVIV